MDGTINTLGELPWSDLLEPSAIVVDRDERQRKRLEGIDELADSILRRGQIQPIVVQRDTLRLIAGERRLTAIRQIWANAESGERSFDLPLVRVVYSDEIDAAELQALELEENIKRVDLPWKDQCAAIRAYHLNRRERDPEWSETATAKALGLSTTATNDYLLVAHELARGNKLVEDSPKFTTARGIVARHNERKAAAETSQLLAMATAPKPRPQGSTSGDSPESGPAEGEGEAPIDYLALLPTGTGFILNEDFSIWSSDYEGPKFNLLHCDFPYGVGMHKSDQGSGDSYGTYEDTPEIYWSLLDNLLNNLDSFCEPSAHIIFWFSMDYYADTLARFSHDYLIREANGLAPGFRINPFPLIWHKSDGAGIIPDANRGPRRTYETALLGSRGDRKIVRPVANSVASPIQRGRHMSEKPQAVLNHFFRMVVDEHSAVLDPTCGSGSAIRAAATSGASRYLGLELNTEFAEHADEVLRYHLEELESPKTEGSPDAT